MHTLHAILENPIMLQSSNPKRIAMNVADRTASPSPTTVARKLSNPEVPQTRPSYTKTSISHILPVTWKSPITAPPEENPAHRPKLSKLYRDLPRLIRSVVKKDTFDRVFQAAIPDDRTLQQIFNDPKPPLLEISSVRNSVLGSTNGRWVSVALRFDTHTTAQFVFQQYKDYKLVGWCHQDEQIRFRPTTENHAYNVNKPIWATLTTHNKHSVFESGKKTATIKIPSSKQHIANSA